jgi:hypothetical protein
MTYIVLAPLGRRRLVDIGKKMDVTSQSSIVAPSSCIRIPIRVLLHVYDLSVTNASLPRIPYGRLCTF